MNAIIERYIELFLGKGAESPLSEHDLSRLRAALNRAYTVRDFEIQMYWTRSAYFWGLQVAFFATAGLIIQGILGRNELNSQLVSFGALSAFAISVLGLTSSYIWRLMLDGAKFWQDNWERHIDVLESILIGPLYRTYFVSPENMNPSESRVSITSVTDANEFITYVFVAFWLCSSIGSFSLFWATEPCWFLTPDTLICSMFLFLYGFALFAATCYFKRKLRSSMRAKVANVARDRSHNLAERQLFEIYDLEKCSCEFRC